MFHKSQKMYKYAKIACSENGQKRTFIQEKTSLVVRAIDVFGTYFAPLSVV
jgi:hypothetical protein